MRLFKSRLILLALIALSACHTTQQTISKVAPAHNSLSSKEKKEGWQLLFDGSTLNGWSKYGGAPTGNAWIIKDSSIYLDADAMKGGGQNTGGDIITQESFEDFHLKYDWKISKGGNSGLIFYVNDDTSKYQWPWQTGPEMQVLDNDAHPDAKFIKHRAGDLYDLVASSSEPVNPALEWNHAEIRSVKGRLDFYLNNVPILSVGIWDDNWKKLIAASKFKNMPGFGSFHSGKISLQDHGDKVWFRNIKIRKL
jgi:hypothetical protein